MLKHRFIVLTVGIVMLLSFSSCDFAAKYPVFEFEYKHYPPHKNVISMPQASDKTWSLGDSISVFMADDGKTLVIADSDGTSLEMGLSREMHYFTIDYFEESSGLEYLIINFWISNVQNIPRYAQHTGAKVVLLDSMTLYEYPKGKVPLVLNGTTLYYFDTLSIYSEALADGSDVQVQYTLPFEKEIPNYINPSDDPANESTYVLYRFTITDDEITLEAETAEHTDEGPELLGVVEIR